LKARAFQNTKKNLIFIKYFPSYEIQKLQSSALAPEP